MSCRIPAWTKIYLLAFFSLVSAQRTQPQFSLGILGGWYQPSLAKANAALKYAKHELSGIGDDEFSGNSTIGALIEFGLDSKWTIRGETFYWHKEAFQTVSALNRGESEVISGRGTATIRIIPNTLNAFYHLRNYGNRCSFYWGMGVGVALTHLEIQAQVRENNNAEELGAIATRQIFSAEDSNWGVLLQTIIGTELHALRSMSIFAEGRFITGQFRVDEPRYEVNEAVMISGFKIAVGIKYNWGF
jgi:hypothetical protein